MHNTQPWRFTVTGQAIDLYADADRQRRAFGRDVILQPREQAAGQRVGFERVAVGVPVRHRPEHRPLIGCYGCRAARPYPGQ